MLLKEKIVRSSIGRKFLMAGTGLVLIGFITMHMLGNLQFLEGADAINSYAAFLQSKHGLLWSVRAVLLGVLTIHVVAAFSLYIENRRARPVRYVRSATIQATISSRTMLLTGLVIFSFLVFHLLHYTVGAVHPQFYQVEDHLGRHDVFTMLVLNFREPSLVFSYILSVALLAFHLRHALPSFLQTLGWNGKRSHIILDRLGIVYAIIIFLGYASVPLSVLLRLATLPGEV